MMPVYQAALLVLALALLLWLTGRLKLHPFLALFVVAVAYGLAADMSVTTNMQDGVMGQRRGIDGGEVSVRGFVRLHV